MYKKFPLNAILSPQDDRDYALAMIAPTLATPPETLLVRYPRVKNQGEVGSCVAHALSSTRELREQKQGGEFTPFSVGYIYANRKTSDYQEEGMFPRQALDQLKSCGDVPETDFPYNDIFPVLAEKLAPLKEQLLVKSLPYRITAYTRLNTLQEYKSAVAQGLDTILTIPVYESFYNTDASGNVPMPNVETEQLYGYHCIAGAGYSKDAIQIMNSWDKEWGLGGYASLPAGYPIAEMWSLTDRILPKVDPNQKVFHRVVMSSLYRSKQATVVMVARLKAYRYKPVVEQVSDGFYIQVGAFPQEVQATQLLAKLKSQGFRCRIEQF